MPLVTLNEMLRSAQAGGYAVPAFDALDLVSAEAVFKAAEETGLPMIAMVPEKGVLYADLERLMLHMTAWARASSVPVAVQLDHGKCLESVMKCIRAGFSSVMIDGSDLPLEENIALTKRVVEIAHAGGVSVEAEIGHVGGGGIEAGEVEESHYTEPDEAVRFVEETGVDALAVSIGTVHGAFRGTPKLDLERLEQIRERISVPLVLHGGSGLSDDDFRAVIRRGICKINIFTELTTTATRQAMQYAQERDGKVYFSMMLQAGAQATEQLAKRYLHLFHMDEIQ